mgnify:CR=1 FL=1
MQKLSEWSWVVVVCPIHMVIWLPLHSGLKTQGIIAGLSALKAPYMSCLLAIFKFREHKKIFSVSTPDSFVMVYDLFTCINSFMHFFYLSTWHWSALIKKYIYIHTHILVYILHTWLIGDSLTKLVGLYKQNSSSEKHNSLIFRYQREDKSSNGSNPLFQYLGELRCAENKFTIEDI